MTLLQSALLNTPDNFVLNTSGRLLIKDGAMMMSEDKRKGASKYSYIYLFSDILILLSLYCVFLDLPQILSCLHGNRKLNIISYVHSHWWNLKWLIFLQMRLASILSIFCGVLNMTSRRRNSFFLLPNLKRRNIGSTE